MRLRVAILALALVLPSAPAAAQGCSMCASSASAAGQQAQRALRRGIVMLLLPPLVIMGTFVGVAARYRRNGQPD